MLFQRNYKPLIPFYFIWASLLIAGVFAIFRGEWTTVFVSALTFILTATPFILEKKYRFTIPIGFTVTIALFVYATLFLGEIGNFYERLWWWDVLLHTGSAIAFGFIGVVLLLMLYRNEDVYVHPRVLAFFAFSFALAIGALWEIFEFSMDSLFGLNMQKTGLVDTMWDLIVDSLGALAASIIAYLYMLNDQKGPLAQLAREWINRLR